MEGKSPGRHWLLPGLWRKPTFRCWMAQILESVSSVKAMVTDTADQMTSTTHYEKSIFLGFRRLRCPGSGGWFIPMLGRTVGISVFPWWLQAGTLSLVAAQGQPRWIHPRRVRVTALVCLTTPDKLGPDRLGPVIMTLVTLFLFCFVFWRQDLII